MKMRLLLIAAAIAYPLTTFAVAGVVIRITLWAYNASGKDLAETVSAATLNGSAATLLWLAFIGGFDMFFTIWQMMQNRQQAAEHQKERESWEEQRKAQAEAQEEQRKAQALALEEQRKVQAQTLEEQRQFNQAFLQQLAAEREENRRRWEEDRRRWEMERREWEESRREEEESRRQREEERRREREESRRWWEENRKEREQSLTALLETERERSAFFMARLVELAERVGNGNGRNNGGRGNGSRNGNDSGANGGDGVDNNGVDSNNGNGNGNGAAPDGVA